MQTCKKDKTNYKTASFGRRNRVGRRRFGKQRVALSDVLSISLFYLSFLFFVSCPHHPFRTIITRNLALTNVVAHIPSSTQ